MYRLQIALATFMLLASQPAFAGCACMAPATPQEDMQQKAADSARKLPSEADRQLARNLRMKRLVADAAQYFKSAASKAALEVEAARTDLKSANDLEQTALHSAAVHREAASYFASEGEAAIAAENWESAIANELMAHKPNADLATEYGTVARLYEQAKNFAKAADMYKKQGDMLASLHGRYDHNAQFAYGEYTRLTRKLRASL